LTEITYNVNQLGLLLSSLITRPPEEPLTVTVLFVHDFRDSLCCPWQGWANHSLYSQSPENKFR